MIVMSPNLINITSSRFASLLHRICENNSVLHRICIDFVKWPSQNRCKAFKGFHKIDANIRTYNTNTNSMQSYEVTQTRCKIVSQTRCKVYYLHKLDAIVQSNAKSMQINATNSMQDNNATKSMLSSKVTQTRCK